MTGKNVPPLVVFSDLDGTLLDHETYSFEPAQPALDALKTRGVPLILASSKTAAEIADLRGKLGFADCPSIVENGAGILEPADGVGDREEDASVHDRLIATLDALPLRLREHFSGFSDWTLDEVAERTGLSRTDAVRAAARRHSEPGLWWGDEAEREEFIALLAERGITARQGGRYLTLSFGATKADRMREITSRYVSGRKRPVVLALGDAANDVEMLEAADLGVVVANPHAPPLPELDGENAGRIVRTEKPGPEGWNESVLGIIEELDGS
ncbi:HAD-IIB family hydrolase [Oricola thermophila]|uniref:HAD-IIB family hydrolase n=1 Tax=Oricola thermophila TaxID=2742145 RepID=UPI001FE301A0|nr:HAD-IIB family hydrolase [Oricola thermophila]